ncbi:MAG: anti-sigma-I factor RsgI family protein [Anaerovoracaceae bacterium]|jgi:hypothetical protein
MKGIVLEIKNNDAIILSDNGIISKITNHDYKIGEVIIMKENRRSRSKFIAWAASIAAALAVFTIGAFAYNTPSGYVSLDVNPSIEYSINMFDRVLEVKAVNEDAEEILASLELKNMSISKAIEETVAMLIEEDYITDDQDGGVIITTSGTDTKKAEVLAEKLKERIQTYVDEEDKNAQVEAQAVGKERVDEAKTLGVTPGKLNLVQKLIKSSDNPDEINIEQWLDKPVKEINKTIKENRKALKENKDEQKDKGNGEAVREREEAGKEKGETVRVRDEKDSKEIRKQVNVNKDIEEENPQDENVNGNKSVKGENGTENRNK